MPAAKLIGLYSLFVLLNLQPATGQAIRILIDPGHGGTDHGAVSGTLKESQIALQVAQKLKGLLEKNQNFIVAMTRTRESNLSLQERIEISERFKPDLFMSIHSNASSDPRARGVEFYFQNYLPPDEDSLFLAAHETTSLNPKETPVEKSDIESIVEDLKRQNRMQESHRFSRILYDLWDLSAGFKIHKSIRQAPFYVLLRSTTPSVLVELGYITHGNEGLKLADSEYQFQIAQRIEKAIKTYFDIANLSVTSR